MTTSDSTTEELVREIERRRLRSLVAADIETATELHADDFQLITPSGKALSKAQYLGAVATGEINYLVWEPAMIAVHLAGEMAAVRYRAELQNIAWGIEHPLSSFWHTDIYEHRQGRWQVVWSQATAIA